MKIINIKFKDLTQENWSGGKTKQIYIYPETALYKNKDFLFRLSSASIEEQPSTFTLFLGYTRYLCMLDNSLSLKINNKSINLEKNEIIKFHSEDDVISSSIGNDFNLMIKDDIIEHEIQIENGFISKDQHFIIIFALEKVNITINNEEFLLDKYDTIIIENLDKEEIDLITKDHVIIATLNLAYTN
ncbi:MAG: HutD family protein [Bacilli bacterium]|jgi:environmental stress-induced protein Ves|nr:HutD family protein [Bacilli bacterium]